MYTHGELQNILVRDITFDLSLSLSPGAGRALLSLLISAVIYFENWAESISVHTSYSCIHTIRLCPLSNSSLQRRLPLRRGIVILPGARPKAPKGCAAVYLQYRRYRYGTAVRVLREKGDIFSIAAAMILAQPSSCSVQHPPAMQLCNYEQQQPTLPRRSGAAPPLVPHLTAHSTGGARGGHVCVC